MRRVAVCGSLNMDVFAYAPRLPAPGETLRGERLVYAGGGKGANQAVAAARLGAAVHFHGARGDDDFGRAAEESLRGAGVETSALEVLDAPTGVALIVVGADGENQIVAVYGANERVGAPAPDPEAAVWLTQGEVPVAAVAGTLEAAGASGATALLNAAPAGAIPAELARRFDVVVVNEGELEALGDERPPCVVLTLGRRGARILPDGPAIPAFPANAVDTTGAGDALVGGVAAGLAEGLPLEEALRLGMAAAAVSVEREGCQPAMPTRDEAEERLRGSR